MQFEIVIFKTDREGRRQTDCGGVRVYGRDDADRLAAELESAGDFAPEAAELSERLFEAVEEAAAEAPG